METFIEANRCAARESQLRRLGDSLNTSRKSGKGDVILVCGNREIPAHKLVLETSSLYFETMFRVDMKEANSGRVVFDTIEPDTLETILEFLYVGEVGWINSFEKAKTVLKAAHLFGLDEMFQYCCELLLSSMSTVFFVDVWNVSSLFDKEKIWLPLMEFLFENRCEIIRGDEFLSLSAACIKEFIEFSKSKQICLNEVLEGLLKWVGSDLCLREIYVEELCECLGSELLTNGFIQSLLQYNSIVKSSEIIKCCMKQLLEPSSTLKMNQLSPNAIGCNMTTLVFFAEQLDGETTSNVRSINYLPTCIQQFDMRTMTWKTCQRLGVRLEGVGMMNYDKYVYTVGGALGSAVIMYDVVNNSVQYRHNDWSFFSNRRDAGLCVFKGRMYGFGGQTADGKSAAVQFGRHLGDTEFFNVKDLHYPQLLPAVLASDNYIFVIGGNDTKNGLVVEYSSSFAHSGEMMSSWEIIKIPNVPVDVYRHFYILDKNTNRLQGMYFFNDCLFRLEFRTDTERLDVKGFSMNPPDKKAVAAVYHFPGNDDFVFVSTLEKRPCIPNFLWEPETGNWLKLPHPRGKCDLVNLGEITKFINVYGLPC